MLEEQKKTVEKKVEDMEDVENTSDADQSPELSDQMYGKSNTDQVEKQETEVRPLNSYSTLSFHSFAFVFFVCGIEL